MITKIVVNVCIIVVALQSTIFAQEEALMMKTFTAYMYGTLDEAAREDAVKALLAENPEIVNGTLNDVPIFQWTLDLLAYGGDLNRKARICAELLIQHGADVDGKDSYGNTFLLHYALFARIAQMEFLVTHGADVTAKDVEDERTALHRIALLRESSKEDRLIENSVKAAGVLLDAGADVNARDSRGNTPLHAAAFLGNLRMVKLLVSRGADIDARNDTCYSVLGLVLLRNNEQWASANDKKVLQPVIAYLQDLGARNSGPYGPDGRSRGCGAEPSGEEAEPNLEEWFELPEEFDNITESDSVPPNPSAVPEPTTVVLFVLGLLGLSAFIRHSRKKP